MVDGECVYLLQQLKLFVDGGQLLSVLVSHLRQLDLVDLRLFLQ